MGKKKKKLCYSVVARARARERERERERARARERERERERESLLRVRGLILHPLLLPSSRLPYSRSDELLRS